MTSHRDLDRRSLALHRLAVAKIEADPRLFDKVRRNNARFLEIAPRSRLYGERWAALIDAGMKRCLSKAVEDSEEAAALRQASPFAGVLTDDERQAFLRSWAADRETLGA